MARPIIGRFPAMLVRLPGICLILVLAGCGGQFAEPVADTQTRFLVPLEDSPVRGTATAWVTMVEFADFECPYCRAAQPVVDELRQTYGEKLRLVFKHLPLAQHPWAEPAAELSIEARVEQGDDGFWRTHDALWPLQPSLSGGTLEALGGDSSGSIPQLVHQAVTGRPHADVIARDLELVDRLRVKFTPTFFIDGRQLWGARPVADFVPIIDEEMRLAGDLVARGLPPGSIYDTLMQSASVPAP